MKEELFLGSESLEKRYQEECVESHLPLFLVICSFIGSVRERRTHPYPLLPTYFWPEVPLDRSLREMNGCPLENGT